MADSFGYLLRELREERGISQAALARTIGVSPSYLSAVENGKKPPLSVEKTLEVIEHCGGYRYDLMGARSPGEGLQVRFDGPPEFECGRFIEAEDLSGRSVRAGEWVQDGDEWLLKIYHLPKVKEE